MLDIFFYKCACVYVIFIVPSFYPKFDIKTNFIIPHFLLGTP